MDCVLIAPLRSVLFRQTTTLWNFPFYRNSHRLCSNSNRRYHKLLNISVRAKTTKYIEIIGGTAENPVSNDGVSFSKKGYVEIWRKGRKREQVHTTKTLSDMREDIDKLAQTIYKLRANEKSKREKPSSQVVVSEPKFEEEGLRLSTSVDGAVEQLLFTVRTPDRRILIKKFTGITVSRTILEMLRDRKVRINEVVTYDFAIVCKPMDTMDIWKAELEDNPAFARIDRFQILHIMHSSCYQYFTVHAIALRDFVVENWFPWKIP